jgi:biopolymer transport protein ExbD
MKLSKESKVSDEIPTASMADIAFLLIIYFMVTTTFTATRGLDFALPKEDDAPPVVEKEESVHIRINPGGSLVVDGRPMQLSEVLDYLQPKLERNPMKPVIIQPDPAAAYGDMVAVFDELRVGKENFELAKQGEPPKNNKTAVDVRNISIPTRREIESFWY